ncbi:MAG TPA: flagellar hook-basal body protein [Clostridiaceae bacterium]|nr:flagellar hook-basal body protein [Clostridiaceae bacterium]
MIIRSLYNVTRQMNVLQKKQENNSANAANVNTPGYKMQDLIQRSMQEYEVSNSAGGRDSNRKQSLGTINMGTEIDGAYTNFSQGILKETGSATDIAINGPGFFTLSTENGETGFTRNGSFRIADDNRLVSQEGYPVLGMNGAGNPTEIYVMGDTFSVDQRGYVNGSDVRLMVTNFPENTAFAMRGENIYMTGAQNLGISDAEISQGYLETANVDIMDEMIKMMEVSREFQSNQRVLSVLNETLQKTVNEIGRN